MVRKRGQNVQLLPGWIKIKLLINCEFSCFWLFVYYVDVPWSTFWYDRSRRHGSINSAAVGTISNADFSGLERDEYCFTKRAFDASNPGKLAICAINELLVSWSESANFVLIFFFFCNFYLLRVFFDRTIKYTLTIRRKQKKKK